MFGCIYSSVRINTIGQSGRALMSGEIPSACRNIEPHIMLLTNNDVLSCPVLSARSAEVADDSYS